MNVQRRTFLQGLGAGSLLLISGTCVSACSGFCRSDLTSDPTTLPSLSGLDSDGARILHYASLAPSGHNTQPWQIKLVDHRKWIICQDGSRSLPAVDPFKRELFLSLGTFIENLTIAAGALGYVADVKVVATGTDDVEVARVELRKHRATEYPLRRLEMRRTLRKGFLPNELTSDDRRLLLDVAPENLLYFPRSSAHAECLRDVAVESFRKQTWRDDAQTELSHWIRFSNQEARDKRDGVTTETMEIDGFAGWFMRTFMDASSVLGKTFRQSGIDGVAKQANEGGGWLILTSDGSSPNDLIEAGRRFERLALQLRERNLAVHPMTQMIEENMWDSSVDKHNGLIPQFVLRIGYLKSYPPPVSLRRPVADFITL